MGRRYRIGFIGCGNMGSAILKGILSAGLADADEVICSCHSSETKSRLEEMYKVAATRDNLEVAKNADLIFLAVKPNKLEEAAREIAQEIKADQILVSVVAGANLAKLQDMFMSLELAGKLQLVRTMPNTPAMVGEAMTAVCPNESISEKNLKYVIRLFESFGKAEVVPESLMDTVTGVSGSSPAYIYILIEAMADEAVKQGMPRSQAYTFASQAVLGSAKMVLETGKHPGELKDAVTSPGGTTIAGLAVLEDLGFRSAIMNGIDAAIEKSKSL